MMKQRKPRGRPPGDGVDDEVVLTFIARQIVESPELKPAKAMRAFCDASRREKPSEAERRRWHAKWAVRKDHYLMGERERLAKETQLAMQNSMSTLSAEISQTAYRASRLLEKMANDGYFDKIVESNRLVSSVFSRPEFVENIARLSKVAEKIHLPEDLLMRLNQVKGLDFNHAQLARIAEVQARLAKVSTGVIP